MKNKKRPALNELPDITEMNPSDNILKKVHICYCAFKGVKQEEISNRYNVVPRTIRNMLNKVKEEGIIGLIDKKRDGRKPILNPELKANIVHIKMNDPSLSCEAIVQLLLEKYSIELSRKTVERFLKSVGLLSEHGIGVKKTRKKK